MSTGLAARAEDRCPCASLSGRGLCRVALPPKPFQQQKRQLSRGMRGIYTVQASQSRQLAAALELDSELGSSPVFPGQALAGIG